MRGEDVGEEGEGKEMMEIDVRVVEDRRSRLATVCAWVAALWWPMLLLVCLGMAFAGTAYHYTDDGDPSVRIRFGSGWDAALVVGLIVALTLEARRGAVALAAWRRRRTR